MISRVTVAKHNENDYGWIQWRYTITHVGHYYSSSWPIANSGIAAVYVWNLSI